MHMIGIQLEDLGSLCLSPGVVVLLALKRNRGKE